MTRNHLAQLRISPSDRIISRIYELGLRKVAHALDLKPPEVSRKANGETGVKLGPQFDALMYELELDVVPKPRQPKAPVIPIRRAA